MSPAPLLNAQATAACASGLQRLPLPRAFSTPALFPLSRGGNGLVATPPGWCSWCCGNVFSCVSKRQHDFVMCPFMERMQSASRNLWALSRHHNNFCYAHCVHTVYSALRCRLRAIPSRLPPSRGALLLTLGNIACCSAYYCGGRTTLRTAADVCRVRLPGGGAACACVCGRARTRRTCGGRRRAQALRFPAKYQAIFADWRSSSLTLTLAYPRCAVVNAYDCRR